MKTGVRCHISELVESRQVYNRYTVIVAWYQAKTDHMHRIILWRPSRVWTDVYPINDGEDLSHHNNNGYRRRTIWFQNPAFRLFRKVYYLGFAQCGQLQKLWRLIEEYLFTVNWTGEINLAPLRTFVSASGALKKYIPEILFTGLEMLVNWKYRRRNSREHFLTNKNFNWWLKRNKYTHFWNWQKREQDNTVELVDDAFSEQMKTKQSLWMDYGKITWR